MRASMRRVAIDALHVFVLWSFAVAQPLYDVLGRHAEFFVAHHTQPSDLLLFVGAISLAAPALVAAVLAASALLGHRAQKGLYLALAAIGAACVVLPPLKQVAPSAETPLIVAALLVGVLFAAALGRFRALRAFLTVACPAVLIFPAWLLWATPVAGIAFPGTRGDSEARTVARPTPVVLVVFDQLPVTSLMDAERNVDAARYPGFGRLARRAHWFRNATTVSTSTSSAVPAILTGRYARDAAGKLPVVANYPGNLFTLLGGSYELDVVETATRLCPESLCGERAAAVPQAERLRELLRDELVVYLHILLPAGWTDALPPVDVQWGGLAPQAERGAVERELQSSRRRNRVTTFLNFVDRLASGGPSSLFYLHVALPHEPYVYLPSARTYVPSGREFFHMRRVLGTHRPFPPARFWKDDEALVRLAYLRHALQLGVADRLLGRLLARLTETGAYDSALVVVVSDHGMSFVPGQSLRSTEDGNTLRVPLFVKLPNQRRGGVRDDPVETIDILPTIADVLGVEPGWPVDGRSLARPARAARPGRAYYSPGTGQVELDARHESLASALERKIGSVGSGPLAGRVFGAGPHGALVGRTAAELAADAAEGVAARIDQRALFLNVDPRSGFVPAYLTGHLQLAPSAPLELAVGVNGVIRATFRSYRSEDGEEDFAVMVPENAFVPGPNHVELYLVRSEGAGAARLTRVERRH